MEIERVQAYVSNTLVPYTPLMESNVGKFRRLSKSALGFAKNAIPFLPIGNGLSRIVTGLYYLVHYGPLAVYSSEIVETIGLVAQLIERSGGGPSVFYRRIFGGDLALKIYYLMAEARAVRVAPTGGTACPVDVTRRVLKYCTLAVHIAYESSAVDAQRLLGLQGYTLVVAGSSYPFFLACRDKEAVLILPGTRNLGDLPTDLDAFEVELGGHRIHNGIAKTANLIVGMVGSSIGLLHTNGFAIRIAGHSLGAGIGAIVAYILNTEHGVKDIHCFGFGCPPCVSSIFGHDLERLVTNVVLRDDIVCRLSRYTVSGLIAELESAETSVKCGKYLENDWWNLKRNWASFFHLKLRPAIDNRIKCPPHPSHQSLRILQQARQWFSNTFAALKKPVVNLESTSVVDGLWIPGKVILIDQANVIGQMRASFISRQHPCLSRIQLQTEMINDHKGESYFRALTQISLNPICVNPPSDHSSNVCSCCGGDFLWNSVLKGEPHIWLAQHVCRRCGRLVCDACSKNYRAIPDYGFIWPVRHCDRCYLSPTSKL